MNMVRPDPSLDYARLEHRLRARLRALRAEIHESLLRGDIETYGELAGRVHDAEDEAVADLLTDINLAEISREVQEVRDIDAAMRRMADRTYASCTDCGEPIDPARLDAYPTAKRCLTCQRAHESRIPATRPPKL
jgi:RNA polymerase-binding transcription factor DksA